MRHVKKGPSSSSNHRAILNQNSDDPLVIEGFVYSTLRSALTWTLIALTLGLIRLYFFWKPALMLKSTHRRCSLSSATKILVIDKYKQVFIEDCKVVDGLTFNGLFPENSANGDFIKDSEPKFRSFINKREKFYWNEVQNSFEPLLGLESDDIPLSLIRELNPNGLSPEEAERRLIIYGPNSIRVDLTPISLLLIREVLSPFYVFQVFSMTLWCFENYYYYAACIFAISALSIIYSLYSIRHNEQALRDMISKSTRLRVHRGGCVLEDIDSEDLVPGDLVEIEQGHIMQFDGIIINGNVIVNESMLTGESIPITKVGIGLVSNETADEKEELLCLKNQKKSILFAGTSVIQTRYYANEPVKAVVVRTGFRTSKGELVRAILFPKPIEFRFNTDLYKYILALALIAIAGMIFTIVLKIIHNASFSDILIKSLDLISIVIPPALPGALTACLIYAQTRLKSLQIYCISPSTINVSGSVTTFVFDKTGTLTEDDCSLRSILPSIWSPDNSAPAHFVDQEVTRASDLEPLVVQSIASCHSITRINHRLDGDPLDLKLFEFTGWELIEPTSEETTNFDCMMPTIVRSAGDQSSKRVELGILRQFPFMSALQRMSVVVKSLDNPNFEIYSKGSPEIIRSLCLDVSIPKNFNSVLNKYARKGYRVLGIAYKELDSSYNIVKIEKTPREKLEVDLIFLGLVIMENKLKSETSKVIHTLTRSNIRPIMCTGDNLLTAISVARDCGMLVRPNESATNRTKSAKAATTATRVRRMGRDKRETKKTPTPQHTWATNEKAKIVIVEADSYEPNQFPRFVLADAHTNVHLAHFNIGVFKTNGFVDTLEMTKSSTLDDENETEESGGDYENNNDETRRRLIKNDGQLHFAISGNSFEVVRKYYPELFEILMKYGSIFARMSPDQKLQLIEGLQALNYFVGMCGDGANDCEALKSANTGVSLSQAEASIASPFTSKTPNISCVPLVILEGRSTLVASFGLVKFICMYSLTQFISVILLYTLGRNLADMQFLYIDLILITFMAFFFSRNRPFHIMHYKSPSSKLLSWRPILSLLFHVTLIILTQVWPFELVRTRPWFESSRNYESSAIFLVSTFQYVTEAVVFSASLPYRKSILSNRVFIVYVLIAVIINLVLATQRLGPLNWFLEIARFPDWKFNLLLVLIGLVHFFLAFIFETFVFDKDFSALYSIRYKN